MSDEKKPQTEHVKHAHNEELEALRHIFNTYARPAVIFALVITVVLVGISRFRGQSTAKEQQAQALLAKATSETELETVLNDYPRSQAAPLAMLALAKQHYAAARFPQAIEQYEAFIATYPRHDLLPAAQLGMLICRAEQTPSQEAATALATFAEALPTHFLTPQALLAEARCLKAIGELDTARVRLEDMTATADKEGWGMVAEEQLAQLTAELQRTANPMPVPEQPQPATINLLPEPEAGMSDTPAPVIVIPPTEETPTPEAVSVQEPEPEPAPAPEAKNETTEATVGDPEESNEPSPLPAPAE